MDQRLSSGDYSLNADVGDEGTAAFQDFLEDDGPSPEDNAFTHFDGGREHRELSQAIAALDAREQRIIRERHLAEAENAATLEDLGAALGISKERVRQLETRALAKLKTRLTGPLDKQAA
jgi:RNA polymerase sigma-32 factor